MIRGIASLIIITLAFAFGFFILYMIMDFLSGTKSRKREFRRSLNKLKSSLDELKESIIPFEMAEFKIISQRPEIKRIRRSSARYYHGFLSTIYQEPLVAFALKAYPDAKKVLTIVTTSKNEILFVSNKYGTIDVQIDGEKAAWIDESGRLSNNEGEIVASLEYNAHSQYSVLKIGSEEVAHMNPAQSISELNESDRLFSLFHETSALDESLHALILAVYRILIKNRLNLD